MTVAAIRTALLSVSVLILLLAALQDLRARIIPNSLVLTVAATGLLLGLSTRPFSLWINIAAALLVLVAFGALSHFDILGAGDAKLMAAVTLLVPPAQIAGLILTIALAGGLVSGTYLVLHRGLKRQARRHGLHERQSAYALWWRSERARILDGRSVPYALAIAGGTISHIIAELHRCWSATSCSL